MPRKKDILKSFDPIPTKAKLGPGPGKILGNLEDHVIRHSIKTKDGSITRAPVNDNDIVNKGFSDGQYLKLDGASTTTARIPFAHSGIDVSDNTSEAPNAIIMGSQAIGWGTSADPKKYGQFTVFVGGSNLIFAGGTDNFKIMFQSTAGVNVNDSGNTGFTTAGFVKNAITGDLSGGNSIDISTDTNLAVTSPIVLTNDTLSFDDTGFRRVTQRYTEPGNLSFSPVIAYLGNVRGNTSGGIFIGDPMERSGSILSVRLICNCIASEAGATIRAIVMKGNTQVFATGLISTASTGVKQGGAQQASGVDTFVQGDVINVRISPTPAEEGATTKDHVVLVEFELDA